MTEREKLLEMFMGQYRALERGEGSIHPLPAEVGQVEVNIEMRAMVHGIRNRLWLQSAQIAMQVEAKLTEAASEDHIRRKIEEAVAAEVADVERTIRAAVRKKFEYIIDNAIRTATGDGPKLLAQKVADAMWSEIWDKSEGKS